MKYVFSYKYRILYHIIFWLFVFALFAFLYGYKSGSYLAKLNLQLRFAVFEFAFVYFVLYYLIPKFLLKRKIVSFIALFFLFLITAMLLENFAMILPSNPKLTESVFIQSITSSSFYWLALENSFVAMLAASIKLLKIWFSNQKEKTELEKKHLESELELLKSQVNPHFLFNTLNNINTLVFIDQQKTYDSIIKLSELLRYMIYDTKTQKVFLKDEINYLSNYIELQRIRFHKESFIEFKVIGDPSTIKVAPMIYIPFIENAFKYCKKDIETNPGISIHFEINSKKIIFTLWNYKKLSTVAQKSGGVGIENTKKRLNLIYPNLHKIRIDNAKDKFLVYLELDV